MQADFLGVAAIPHLVYQAVGAPARTDEREARGG